MNCRPLGEQGIALVLTLWLVVLLGSVAAAVVTSTRRTSAVVLNARARAVARYAAESGIVAGTAILNRRLSSLPARQQAFPSAMGDLTGLDDVDLGSARFSVVVTNLSGLLDLNYADAETLVGFFSQFTSSSAARALAAVLQDWRDPDDVIRPGGAEGASYARVHSPFVPRNGPLNRLDEFSRLLGVTDSLALAVAPYVTVHGDGKVDVNAAPEPVLAALPGIGPAGARMIVRGRRGRKLSSAAEVQLLLGRAAARSLPRLVVVPTRLLLTSRGRLSGHPLTHEIRATYAVLGSTLVLQSWRERDL